MGGDDNDDLDGDADEGDDDALPGVRGVELGRVRSGPAVLHVGQVHADGPADGDGDPGGKLLSEPLGGNGAGGGVEGALEGRQALPEVLGAARGDDDVHPGGAELDEGQSGEKGREGGEHVWQEGGEDAEEGGGGGALDEVDGEATEVCAPATVGLQQTVDRADGRGHGGGAAAGDVLCDWDGAVGARLRAGGEDGAVIFGEVDGVVSGRVLVLDDCENGVDLVEGVGRLGVACVSWEKSGVGTMRRRSVLPRG